MSNVVGAPFVHDGVLFAVLGTNGNGIKIASFDSAGNELSVTILDSGAGFDARCVAYDGVRCWVAGVQDSGSGRSDVFAYNLVTGEFNQHVIASIKGSSEKLSIRGIYHDAVSGDMWIAVDKALYVGDVVSDNFSLFKSYSSDRFIDIEPVFSDEHVIFYVGSHTYCKAVMLDRETKGDLLGTYRAKSAYVDEYIVLFLKSDGLYQSTNALASSEKIINFDSSIEEPTSSAFIQTSKGLYSVVSIDGGMGLIKFETEVDTTKPKAMFRVLKESF
ncbi:hypothetical protein [Idiomarina abyssalis]|uniref:hypothetical protein n=1 Tax=Idiomarina abyssalis TaxID=86102 RepID=UPI003A922BF0